MMHKCTTVSRVDFYHDTLWGNGHTVYPKEYAHDFCFAVLCCGYTLTDFPISIRLTSLAVRQSNDCPSASKATLMNMDKYFMWIHYERLHNHNKAKHNKTVCIFLGIYCSPKVTVLGACLYHAFAHYVLLIEMWSITYQINLSVSCICKMNNLYDIGTWTTGTHTHRYMFFKFETEMPQYIRFVLNNTYFDGCI